MTEPLALTVTPEQHAALPPERQALYAAAEGGFALQVAGIDGLKNTVAATRKERDDALRELKDLKGKVGDLNPDEARNALKKIRELEEKHLIDAGNLDEVFAKRTEALRKDLEARAGAEAKARTNAERERDNYRARLEEVLVDSGISQAAMKAGVRASAVADVLLRARKVWRLHEGRPTPFRDGGDEPLYGKNPAAPMTMDEWVAGLQADAPHLFETNSGTGAGPAERVIQSGNRITLTREQARDVKTWRLAQDQAAKSGAVVVVQD